VDGKEFRRLLLLLKGDLEEKDIPYCTTMQKCILELQQEQIEKLSDNMPVSLFNLLFIFG
jgi:hypothetical protein